MIWLLLLLLLPGLAPYRSTGQAWGGNLHLDCAGNTHCEMHQRAADWQTPWAVSEPFDNCVHGPSATLQVAAPACRAYVEGGTYVFQAAVTLDYAALGASGGTTTCWLGLHKALGAPVAGWTRQPGTHYVGQCASATRPPPPPEGVLLGVATVSSGAVTTFAPLAPRSPLFRAFGGQVNVLNYGATGDGVTDDSAAFLRACKALVFLPTLAKTLLIPGGLTYKIDAPVPCDPPNETTILAWGADINVTFDGLFMDLNPLGDCSQGPGTGGCQNAKFNLRWVGGRLRNTAPVSPKTAAVAWKAYAIRGLWISETVVRSFWTTLDAAVQDNLHVTRNNWQNAGNFGYHILTRAGMMTSNAGSYYVIMDNTMAGIDMISSIALLENQFYRTISILYNNISGRQTTNFHIVSGSDFSSTPTNAVAIIGNHFEQEDDGNRYIYLQRTTSPHGFRSVTIAGNRLGSGLTDWTGIEAHDAHNLRIDGNFFTTPLALNTREIVLSGAATRTVSLCANTHDPNATPLTVLDGALRAAVTVCPTLDVQRQIEFANVYPPISGLQNEFQAVGGRLLDMSASWGAFAFQTPKIVPKGYWLTATVSDTGSAACAATSCDFGVRRDAAMSETSGLVCGTSGLPNLTTRVCAGYVPADANGDLYVTADTATGASMRVTLRVVALDM